MTDSDRNYVAAWVDYKNDKIIVLERDQEGKLYRKRYNPPYYFYIPDDEGEYTSIFGDKLIRAEFDSREEYEHAKRHFPVKFESDIPPLKRVLMDVYYNRPAPPVNYAFIDLEVDYSSKIGWSSPTNPYAPINAACIYQSWTGKYLSYVVPPNGWTGTIKDLHKEIDRLTQEKLLSENINPKIVICKDEMELLVKTCDALEDADLLSGWNSEFFDIPYICERLLINGGEPLLSRLEYLGCRAPKKEMMNKFGTEEPIYKFKGKAHIDYMKAFKKFTFSGHASYALGNILDEEVGVGKIEYEGTLEELYNNNFPLFTCYNLRDVTGIVDLDNKFKFIALINQMAHESTVLFDAMLGTVSYVETAIINHAHYVSNKIVHDRNIQDHDKVEGAIVLTPTPAVHEMIGSVDVKSEYPNTIRSLNISPEMVVGQFTANEAAWNDIQAHNDKRHTLIAADGRQEILTAAEWAEELLKNGWAISAYGTVFDQSSGVGIFPQVIGFWLTERKRLQSEKKRYDSLSKMETDPAKKRELEKQVDHFELLQITKKISANSAYGALLNPAFRFGSEQIGASVTATGRAITTHVLYFIENAITGIPKKYAKIPGPHESSDTTGEFNKWHYVTQRQQLDVLRSAKKLLNPHQKLPPDFIDFESIIYSDTDSGYFKTYGKTNKEAIEIADLTAAQLNASFKPFMQRAFFCRPDFDDFIEVGREIVASRGLFQTKKKYVLKIIDLEGSPPKPGKELKSQGSEIKKSDTPKIIQKFLKSTIDMILNGDSYDDICTFVNLQRKKILKDKLNVFQIGVAKQVNNLDKYTAEYNNPGTIRAESGHKLTIPGHVRATLNYNALLETFDKGAKTIRSGDKVLIYYIKENQYRFDSIAFPAELMKFPKWFTENFSVNLQKTEAKMFENKLRGIFNALGKDVPTPQSVLNNALLEY